MISYYLDNTTTPGSPRLVRRINNGHPTTFNNNLGTAVAIDIENLTVQLRHQRRRQQPEQRRVHRGRSHRERSLQSRSLLADADPQDQRHDDRTVAEREPAQGPGVSQHAQFANRPARHGAGQRLPVERRRRQDNDNESRFTNRNNESGMALLTVLLVMVLVSGLAAGMFAAVTMEQRSHAIDRDQTQVYSAAHGGLEKLTADLAALFLSDFSPNKTQLERPDREHPSAQHAGVRLHRARRRGGLRLCDFLDGIADQRSGAAGRQHDHGRPLLGPQGAAHPL